MDQPITPTVVTTTTTTTDPEQMAHKLAKIGLLLRKQGQPDALATLQRSLHLHPNGSSAAVWKSLGHALAQDGARLGQRCLKTGGRPEGTLVPEGGSLRYE